MLRSSKHLAFSISENEHFYKKDATKKVIYFKNNITKKVKNAIKNKNLHFF
ncbi:hypothetical protein FUSO4_10620 [Fusobacterium necrophorum DJ-1]|uniref:Uncharacterized protein n=2 Tax=Fusobacterium necrophorum TaxID=859 RepID=A0AB73BWU8_9FUSO|nr:hypothetical protein FUSO4_10620 [Fusobacterium necrophorum DJ-1]KDE62860.1 hypothetical protein FUSO3_06870 [Fusobacterium necrophorum BL]KDE65077.1 hypothetical protein FUSO5_05245 [Fusobacterium necrophorum BFTR-1]KDE68058.1 hypothetical protein FUSO6_09585 [Fusobacterium necrophorum DAB]KDE69245.1 hypothetical protein FUSO7_11865 [Fusobacterium necrophorum BFTR-2]KDE70215.1 hypothetical protein FUSO8_09710 [Fusobacterium necrophorum DJ-2]